MNKTVEIRHKPVIPLYAAGGVWLLMALLLPIYRLWALALTAVLSLAVYLVLQKVCPPIIEQRQVPVTSGDSDADLLLESIEKNRQALHSINQRIPDDTLSNAMDRMENACTGMMAQLQKAPNRARELRRFANHYLPDAVRLLDLYAELDETGVSGENSDAVRREVEQNAEVIAKAFENQLDSLYATRAVEMDTDLDVLKAMLKGQGLV